MPEYKAMERDRTERIVRPCPPVNCFEKSGLNVPRGTLPNLLKNRQPALQGFDQWHRCNPTERRHQLWRVWAARTAEEKDQPSWLHECLQREQGANFHPNGPHGQHAECFVELRAR